MYTYKLIQFIKGFGSVGIEEKSDLDLETYTQACKKAGIKIISIRKV